MTKPNINVTPLIDVLLVLLVIFMVITPVKQASFKTKIPQATKSDVIIDPHPLTLIVTVNSDYSLKLNLENDFGTVDNPEKLVEKLREIFKTRAIAGVFREGTNEVEKTVFIKAPKAIDYGSVAKTIDAVKSASAEPVGLQIDGL